MGYRGKQIVVLTLVAAMVAVVSGVLSALTVIEVAVDQTRAQALLVAQTLYHQVRSVIRDRHGEGLSQAFEDAPTLRDYADAAVGYSDVVVYLAIIDRDGVALFHSDPQQQGREPTHPDSLERFAARPAVVQLWQLRRHRVLALDLPFSLEGDQPFGSVRVALSTTLMAQDIDRAIVHNAILSAIVVLGVFAISFYLANYTLEPIERLRQELARIDFGDGKVPSGLDTRADFSRLAEFFDSIGKKLEQVRHPDGELVTWRETMLGALDDVVLVVDRERRVLSINEPAVKMFNLVQVTSELAIDDLLPVEHPLRELIQAVLVNGDPIVSRRVKMDCEGESAVHEFDVRPIGGVAPGVIVTGRNLERMERLGSHLSYTQKLAVLGRLTSGVVHEIRGPMNAAVLHASLLKEKLDGDDEVRRHLDVIDGEIRRLDAIVDAFSKFTRPETIEFAPVEVGQWVESAVSVVRDRLEQKGVAVQLDMVGDSGRVRGDAGLLREALDNILLNAEEALEDGGRLRIRVERSGRGAIRVAISDTGAGIRPEVLPRLFELFFTTKDSGSGIGLPLSRRIIELHGGRIDVTSKLGGGATFTIELPEARM